MARTTRSKLKTALGEKSRRRREALAERQVARRSTAKPRNDLTPDLHLVRRPLASLRTGNRRLRNRERAHVDSVKRAITAHGQCVPILITGAGEVIDGETRLQAAAELGLESLWCIVVDHLTEEEVRLLRLQTNRLQEQGEWDLEALRLEFAELLELDLPLETTGFTLPEIDQLLLTEAVEEDETDGAVAGAHPVPGAQPRRLLLPAPGRDHV